MIHKAFDVLSTMMKYNIRSGYTKFALHRKLLVQDAGRHDSSMQTKEKVEKDDIDPKSPAIKGYHKPEKYASLQ